MIRCARLPLRYRTGLPGLDLDCLLLPPVCGDEEVRDYYAEPDRQGEATGIEFKRWRRAADREAELARYLEEGD